MLDGVEVPHADLAEVARMVLVEVDAVVVLTYLLISLSVMSIVLLQYVSYYHNCY